MGHPAQGSNEALLALERLYEKKVITLEEGQKAARLIMKDDAVVFPAPKPAPAAPAPEAPSQSTAVPVRSEEPPPAGGNEGTSPG